MAYGSVKIDSIVTSTKTVTVDNLLASGDANSVTSGMIANGTIVDADINGSAAIAFSKLANVSATDKLLGRSTVGAGAIEEITCTAAGRALLDDIDAAAQRTTLGLAIGTNVQAYNANTAVTNAVQTFTAAQRGTVSALGAVTAGTTTLDFATANHFSLSMPAGGTVTLANPSNLVAGQSGCITITQNATTAGLIAYGSYWKFQGGAPALSTTLSSVNVIGYFVESATRITAQLLTNTIS